MADSTNVEALFITLGLDLTQLESDFINVDQTIQQNLNRLNRENNLIQLRADVDIGNLDKVADAEKILEIQSQSLTKQIQIQQDKVKLVSAAHQDLINSQGKNSAETQKMEMRLKREEMALQRLISRLREVAKAQENLNNGNIAAVHTDKNPLLSFYDNLKGKLSELGGGFSILGSALSVADGAITKTIESIGRIPTPVTAAVGSIAALTAGVKAAESVILSLADPAIKAGDSFYVASRGVQMSIKDFAQLSTIAKVTGIELSDVTNAMRRITMQIVKGGDSTVLKTLKKFGVEVRNSNGELKNALELSLALAEGLEKAKAAGKGKDFIAGVFGRQATGDNVTYLEDLKGNVELANSIVKNGLFDPVRAHNLQGNINAMNTQAEQLGSTFSSALMPVAESLVPNITKRMGELTQVIQDNAGGIKKLGEAFANLAEIGEAALSKLAEGGIKILGGIGNLFLGRENSFVEKYLDDKDIKSAEDLMKKHMQNYYSYSERLAIENNPAMYQTTLSKFKDYYKAIEDARKSSVKSWADFRREEENSLKEAVKFTDEEIEESKKRVEKIKEEIEDLRIELDFGKNDSYEKSIAKLDLQFNRLDIDSKPEEEQNALGEKRKLQLEQIERDFEEVEKSFNEKVLELNSTALERKLANIEREKQEWIQKGIDEVKATQWAEQAKADASIEIEQAFADRINSINGSALEQKLANIEREKQEWIKKGIDETRATELAEQQKAKAVEDSENEISKKQDEIRDKEEQLDDEEENLEDLYKQRQKIYEDFARYAHQIISQIQSIWDTELNNQLQRIEEEKQAYIQKGVDEVAAAKWAAQAKVDAERNAAMQILKSQLQAYRAFKQGGYEALKQYELNQLYKQGITQNDLRMTPEQLHKFDFAQKAIQNSLMPNFMTSQDFDRQIAAKNGKSGFKIPDVSVQMNEEWLARLKENSKQIDKANKRIAKLTKAISDDKTALLKAHAGNPQTDDNKNSYVEAKIDGKPVDPKIIEEYFGKSQNVNEPPEIQSPQEQQNNFDSKIEPPKIDNESINSFFDEENQQIENVSSQFADFATNLSSVTDAFSNLIEKFNQLDFSKNNSSPNITNNVSVQEAHAWDYSHIQELAENVADTITPKILDAVRGDSNGY